MPDNQVINWLIYASLLLYVALDATGQGKFADLTREVVAPTKQPAVDLVLHRIYPAKYVVVALMLWAATSWWAWLPVAGLLRLAVFDPVLQWSRKDKLWSLGTSARFDQLLGRAPWLNPFLRVAALLGSVAVMLFL